MSEADGVDSGAICKRGFTHLQFAEKPEAPEAESNQTKSICVGLLNAPENTTPVLAGTHTSVLPILPVFRADISRLAKKRKRRRKREGKKKKMRREESQNVRTCEKDGAEKKRKKRRSVRCDGTHACVEKMKLNRKDGYRRSVHSTKSRVQKSSSIFPYRKKETRTEAHAQGPIPRDPPERNYNN
ncbi:hypothetical protein HZH68_006872 [Vespula germanica]|uniref:Uncharacterized protein n=1 Tax=Vespula germanica TaxID=30212 RepID=A0A834K7Z4_VESGE|nr:hypothetical protein HZH68_006872 [Vespula germanica]